MEGREPQGFWGPVKGDLGVYMGRTKGVWSRAYAHVVVPNGNVEVILGVPID